MSDTIEQTAAQAAPKKRGRKPGTPKPAKRQRSGPTGKGTALYIYRGPLLRLMEIYDAWVKKTPVEGQLSGGPEVRALLEKSDAARLRIGVFYPFDLMRKLDEVADAIKRPRNYVAINALDYAFQAETDVLLEKVLKAARLARKAANLEGEAPPSLSFIVTTLVAANYKSVKH